MAAAAIRWVNVRGALRNTVLALTGIVLLTLPATAQWNIGETSNNLNGTISAGYNADYGNLINSSHSLSAAGSGTLSGYYYNPNFLSYTVSPYLNQARNNSSFQSISNASGVNVESSIFAGSKFPGTVSYSKAYNSEGNFAIPGVANYTTRGNSDTLGLTWSELMPNLPSLTATFQAGSNQYSIYGANDNGKTNSRSLGLRSSYILRGFTLNSYFTDGHSNANIPEILQGSTQTENATSNSRGFGFATGHQLPLHGGFSAAINRSTVSSDFAGYSYSGSIDTYAGTTTFQPTQKFHISINTGYSDNLSGSLYQAIVGSGGVVTPPAQGQASHSLDLQGTASYSIMTNMQVLATADHRQQYFLGKNYSSESYGGGITYGRILFGGNLNTALTATDNTTSASSMNALGFSSTVNYNRRFGGWTAGAFGNYSQNVQTLLITYMSSFYGYGGNLRYRMGRFTWSGAASVNKTGLTNQAGTSNSSESFNSSIGFSNWVNLNATYSKSDGIGIQTGVGIAATPTPQPVLTPTDLILFGGKSYSFGLASNPKRRLTISSSFARAYGNTNVLGVLSSNNTEQINTFFQYQFRKMYMTGGYSRLEQGFSASGTPPEKVSAFYIGVSRWFNFF